ncbi:phage major capsid protein [Secundilactobacillus similis]|uniref:Prophage L54a, major capsid family protein n=1 Tax=Secundilactobacillus similis DSM 23365 = JCM 2765 TaxID=1423804 RepID=A0A0R2EP39_9LACO|nr:phage major capsid protein [Secundilactobacillus similis]KRN17777.1 prophage L54a, major capsid family protein [Secundilactobacillus similis DSM 23365 = JCM 2765]
MTVTLYQKKQSLAEIGAELKNVNNEIAEKAGNPAIEDEVLNQLSQKADSLSSRFDLLKNQIDSEEKASKKKMQQKQNNAKPDDPKVRQTSAMASLIRSTMANQSVSPDVLQALGDDNTTTGGQNILPINVSNQIIAEPFDDNPLRQDETISAITNLILPRVAYSIDDDGFVGDQQVSKEINTKGDQVSFGRFKTKLKAAVSETILNGTDTALVQYIQGALQAALALKEKKVAFATTPAAGEEHMSFYSTETNIKKVTGSSLFDAITQAAGDINDAFQSNIKVYMRRPDYLTMIKELSNSSATLFGKAPEEIIGYPVRFSEKAVTPVVGNFSYAQLNYEIDSTLYEQWKDYDKGINYFGLTAWFDHQVLLASAFRLATVVSK